MSAKDLSGLLGAVEGDSLCFLLPVANRLFGGLLLFVDGVDEALFVLVIGDTLKGDDF